jgi:23S rRNA pseudouridine1911/1915/1917 synthase
MPQETYNFTVLQENAGQRLDRFLYEVVGFVTRMYLRGLIDARVCSVNGVVQPAGYHLQTGDKIEISFDSSALTAMTPEELPLEILFEDEQVLVVNKPAGMLVHPIKQVKSGTLANALTFHLNRESLLEGQSSIQNLKSKIVRPGIIHRLDRETSGLLVVAKTARAHRILASHFERKLVEKIYLAVVEGIVLQEEGTINAPIGRVEEKPHWRIQENGKEAETQFKVIERRANTTLLELEPITGRTNQLRIHCAHINHPIVGDNWYEGPQFSRLCLHAAKLSFFHPDGGWLEFATTAPEEFFQFG